MRKSLFVGLPVLLLTTSWAFSQDMAPTAPSDLMGVQEVPSSDPIGGARGTYVGIFGGGGGSSSADATQNGTALYKVGGKPDGLGPLTVIADGSTGSQGTWISGLHLGHEWSPSGTADNAWGLLPAVEFEAYYLGTTLSGNLVNPTPRIPGHTFADSFPINAGVFLAEAVVSLRTPLQRVYPYLGGGVGSAFVSIHDANSAQISPPEAGINHFNSGTNASCWTFATQAKTGVRFALTERWSLFAEYRFLYLGSTEYTFGPTVYPTHIPTTPWNVHLGGVGEHLAAGGLEFNF
jgi:opacity protein-like surface antigen